MSLVEQLVERLAAAIGHLDGGDRLALGCYVLVAVVVGIDLARPRSATDRLGAARAASLLATVVVSLLLAVPYAAALRVAWGVVGAASPDGLRRWWDAHPVWAFAVCFVVVDLVAYGYHLVGHRTRVGWASHRVHHLGETYDMALVLRQPWLPVHGLVVVPLTALGGFSFELAAACSVVSLAHQALQHTSRGWGLGPLDAVLVSGRAHRHHHLVGGGTHNLGAVLIVWDRAFGTHRSGRAGPDAIVGTGAPEPLDPLRIQLDGWRRPAVAPSPPASASTTLSSPGGPARRRSARPTTR